MKKILLSTGIIIFMAGSVALGGTGAFFSDTETSIGNTFTAGAIDLKIDNTSYYNGVLNQDTTWTLNDLTIQKFFNFLDLKPGDYGEDTISLHVDTNDAYICANVKLTSNDDNTCTSAELKDEPGCTDPGSGQGELAQNVNFIWWADDGDNVLEDGEKIISQGPIGDIGPVGSSINLSLADSHTNIWTGAPGPLPGNTNEYIGKGWCFGTLTPAPLSQDGINTGTPITRGGAGFTCSGSGLNNSTQTDSLTADVSFSAVQARNNPNFLCTSQCDFNPDTNLVADGGFELPPVTDPAKWQLFPDGASGLGWHVIWDPITPSTWNGNTRPEPAFIEYQKNVMPGWTPKEGAQYAELHSDWSGPPNNLQAPSAIDIYQDIATTPGSQYKISFWYSPRPGVNAVENGMEVKWGGSSIATISTDGTGNSDTVWTQYSYTVPATGNTTRLEFDGKGNPDTSTGTFLDDVRLNQQSCVNQ
jgi:predicted ribosomally synthesized peptide with SipW-like signal peptide